MTNVQFMILFGSLILNIILITVLVIRTKRD